MAHDVFISYPSKDKPVADAACATLESSGVRCWIAPRDVSPGVAYAESLVNGLSNSRLMVLVFSANSNRSPQVLREVERAAAGLAKTVLVSHAGGSVHRPEDILKAIMEVAR